MASNKIALKFRSITYPNNETSAAAASGQQAPRARLQRMDSFDLVDASSATPAGSSCLKGRREVSAEGRLKVQQFQTAHSAGSSGGSTGGGLPPGQKLLRFSDECWCTTGEHRLLVRSTGALTSPKGRPGSAVRLGSSSSGNVERLVDWQRKSPDHPHHSVSPSHRSADRRSHSRERRCENCERNYQFSTGLSLPPAASSKQSSEESSATTPTSPPATSETRSRRSQFRRAWSLFSLTCDKEVEKERREKSPQQQSILRPPTRHTYRRGLSGLPIECSSRYLGLAY